MRLKPLGHLSDAGNNLTNLAESFVSRTLGSSELSKRVAISRARGLESKNSGGDYGYGTALVLGMTGRVEEAVSMLRQRELDKPWRLGKLYLTSLRTLLEGKREESLGVSEELMQATFRDPEGMYYLGRQLAYLRYEAQALEILSRAVDNGFFCHQTMLRDPWLDSLRGGTEFTALLNKAHQLHREASTAFLAGGGASLLGIHSEGY